MTPKANGAVSNDGYSAFTQGYSNHFKIWGFPASNVNVMHLGSCKVKSPGDRARGSFSRKAPGTPAAEFPMRCPVKRVNASLRCTGREQALDSTFTSIYGAGEADTEILHPVLVP